MTRSFLSEPIAEGVVDQLIDLARRAPSAGNTSALHWLVLDAPEQLAKYWDITLAKERRSDFAWPELLNAPVIVVVWVDPQMYLARYREKDKAHTSLGESLENWPVPYWFVDGGAAVQTFLLGAEALGLGALFFGLFDHESAVRKRFAVPKCCRALGAIALGYRANDRSSLSVKRQRRAFAEVVHRGRW